MANVAFIVIFVVICLTLVEGGDGKQGLVLSVEDEGRSSWRSFVEVEWDVGGVGKYRRGHQGLIDVKCVAAAEGKMFYVDHLPTLGNHERQWAILHQKKKHCFSDIYSLVVVALMADIVIYSCKLHIVRTNRKIQLHSLHNSVIHSTDIKLSYVYVLLY